VIIVENVYIGFGVNPVSVEDFKMEKM